MLPAFGLVYLLASPLRLRARISHLLAAFGAMIISAGWFIALVDAGFGGSAGLLRVFGTAFGTQISWLLPAALIALVVGLVASAKAPRTNRVRAGLIMWGTWLITTALVFSFMSGTIHPYSSVALSPRPPPW